MKWNNKHILSRAKNRSWWIYQTRNRYKGRSNTRIYKSICFEDNGRNCRTAQR